MTLTRDTRDAHDAAVCGRGESFSSSVGMWRGDEARVALARLAAMLREDTGRGDARRSSLPRGAAWELAATSPWS